MLDVMIIDDDKIIRERLKAMIEWEQLGLNLVCEAADSDTARELYLNYHPKIIITDICIPVISGIELAEELIVLDPHIRFIIITGYNDFEYAKKTVRLGAVDLLSKPIFPNEINASLQRAMECFERERENFKNAMTAKRIDNNLNILKSSFVEDVLAGHLTNESLIQAKLQVMGIQLSKPFYVAVVIEPDTETCVQPKEGIQSALMKAVHRYLRHDAITTLYCSENEGKIHCLINMNFQKPNEAAERIVGQFQEHLRFIAGLKIYAGIGYAVKDLTDLPKSHTEAQVALSYQKVVGNTSILHYQNIRWLESSVGHSENIVDDMLQLFSENELDKLVVLVEKHITALLNIQDDKNDLISVFCAEYLMDITTTSMAMGLTLEEKKACNVSVSAMYHLKDPMKKMEYVLGATKRLLSYVFPEKVQEGNYLVEKAKFYIGEHLGDSNMDLEQVANEIGLSYVYFCKLFHEEEGISFSNYIKNLRIEKAKKLLTTSKMRVCEIGDHIGFSNSKYFGYVFKKEVGMTPLEYQKANIEKVVQL